MAGETKLVLSLLFLVVNCMQYFVYGEPQVLGVFIYGDSLSDNGNNNNLETAAKSNYKPYGIDFPDGATGRFTNAETAIDLLVKLLGFDVFIPPFANTTGFDILKGVNYASGAAGIRNESGKHLGDNIYLGLQLEHHKRIFDRIATRLGGLRKAKEHLSKCLYYVSIGSNDYINNYFLPQLYPTSRFFNVDQYANVLIDQLRQHLQDLYFLGARKFVLVGLGSIGCTPNAISTHKIKDGTCVEGMNNAAFIFSNKLKSLADELNAKSSADSKYIFINSTASIDASFGINVLNVPCCPTREDGQCAADQIPCKNRNEYAFWDAFHPTYALNKLTAIATYNTVKQHLLSR